LQFLLPVFNIPEPLLSHSIHTSTNQPYDLILRSLWLFFEVPSSLLLLGVALPGLAQQRRLVEEGCRQGSCWATYFLDKRLIHQNQLGGQNSKLYEVSLEVSSD
ncbi:hypothetical protein VB780_14165, partial [Leptolyngbya sp. CCNP1308]|uniref:hypothetical protein n=1 Tax=Leptolyngbya sp. CCNP1308 TaxID=3110255 RepID=UPI002B21121E